jgi:segregation and condensation protein B
MMVAAQELAGALAVMEAVDDALMADEGADELTSSAQTPTTTKAAQVALWQLDGEPSAPSALIESILFVADRPVALAELSRALDLSRPAVDQALESLAEDCLTRGVRLQRNNGHVQLVSAPESAPAVQRFLGLEDSARLSRAALEALSIIAYRQPITRPEIDDLRGVNSDGVLRTLLARGMAEPIGQRDTVGHPIEYGTTFRFLEYFGIPSLESLPPLNAAGWSEEILEAEEGAESSEAADAAEPAEVAESPEDLQNPDG